MSWEYNQGMSPRQKAANNVTSTLRLFVAAETKRDADRLYVKLQESLRDYYNLVWEAEEKEYDYGK